MQMNGTSDIFPTGSFKKHVKSHTCMRISLDLVSRVCSLQHVTVHVANVSVTNMYSYGQMQ